MLQMHPITHQKPFNCILCFEQNKVFQILLNSPVLDRKTVKDAIKEQFTTHQQILTGSSSGSQSICIKCFNFFKDFYKFKASIDKKHKATLQSVFIKSEAINFVDVEQPPPDDIRQPRLIISKIKTEPEDIQQYLNEFEETRYDFKETRDEAERLPEELIETFDSNFEVKLEEDSRSAVDFLEVDETQFEDVEFLDEAELPEVVTKRKNDDPDYEKEPKRRRQGEGQLKCDSCDKFFINEKTLSAHHRVFHEEEPYVCKLCGKTLRGEYSYKRHMESHERVVTEVGVKNRRGRAQVVVKIAEYCEMKCHECNVEMPSYFELKSHFEEVHKGINLYLICRCGRKYENRADLIKHIDKHEGSNSSFKCEICGKILKSAIVLRRHHRNYHEGDPFKCNLCGKIFRTERAYNTHMDTHNVKENDDKRQKRASGPLAMKVAEYCEIKCHECDLDFESYFELKNHFKEIHPGIKLYLICKCGSRYTSRSDLIRHIDRHEDETEFKCEECGKVFKHEISLKNHVQNYHVLEPFKCTLCGKEMRGEKVLQVHMETHKEKEHNDGGKHWKRSMGDMLVKIGEYCEWKCHECDQLMESFYELKSHFKENHPTKKSYLICRCGKKYENNGELIRHIDQHEDANIYKCEICNKTLKTQKGLTNHNRIFHTENGQESFICPQCGKSLVGVSSYRFHMLTHETRTFECFKCGSKCKNMPALKAHLYIRHNPRRDPRVNCKVCGKEVSRFALNSHMKGQHSAATNVKKQCPFCEHWIVACRFQKHVKDHSITDLHCDICNAVLGSPIALRNHKKLRHEEPKIQCQYCERKFKSHIKVKEHEAAQHTREILFKCEVEGCSREFRSRGKWTSHVKKDHPEVWERKHKPAHLKAPEEAMVNEERSFGEFFE